MKVSILSLTLILLAVIPTVGQTTEFTYQGSLKDGANAANGNYDFEFLMFDTLSGGSQVGSTLTRSTVAVANGTFSVKLDFGGQFPGSNRFLEIHVRTAGGGAFTTLAPRQPVSSSPYAVQSLNAANATAATTAANAAQLGGVAANQYVLTGDARLSDARAPTAGSSNYIQNGNLQQSASNFNISGDGTVGGTLSGNIINAASQFNLAGNRAFTITGSAASPNTNTFAGFDSGTANLTQNGAVLNTFFGSGTGKLNSGGSENSFFGSQTGRSNTTGVGNSYFGDFAGASNSIAGNGSFFGSGAGYSNTTGDQNSFFGQQSGNSNVTGSNNSFFGVQSGLASVGGSNNSFFGHSSGSGNQTGSANSIFGYQANVGSSGLINATAIGANSMVSQSNSLVLGSIIGFNGATADTNVGIGTTAPTEKLQVNGNILVSNQVTASQFNTGSARLYANSGFHNLYFGENAGSVNGGTDNTFVGWNAGAANASNSNSFFGAQAGKATTTGSGNTFNGDRSGLGNTSGNLNSFFGNFAGSNNTTGSSNTFVGQNSGSGNSSGSFNTGIGAGAAFGVGPLTNATAIGAQARVDASNSLVLGSVNGVNGATANTNVGIGTTSPGVTLDVRNDQASAIFRLRSTAGSSSIFLDRASAVAANSAQIAFNSAGTADFAMGTSQGSAGFSDFSIYNYGTASNAFTIQRSTGSVGIGTTDPGSPAGENSRFAVIQTNANTWASRVRTSGIAAGSFGLLIDAGTGSGDRAFRVRSQSGANLFSVTGNGLIGIGTDTPGATLDVNGSAFVRGSVQVTNDLSANRIYMTDATGFPGATSLCVTPTGPPYVIVLCASSLRFKTNLGTFKSGLELINRLKPITFDWKVGGMKDFGLAAEDVAAVEPLLATYDSKGVVQGVKYDRIGVVLINAVKEQQAQIEVQQKQIEQQDAVNKRLQAEIDALKKLVCSKRSRAAVCR